MKLLFYFLTLLLCLPICSNAGLKEALNPTKLWELRDSLEVLVQEETYSTDAKRILREIQPINIFLSRVEKIIPLPNLQIDIVESPCPSRAVNLDEIRKLVEGNNYQTVAIDCEGNRTIASHIAKDPNRRCIAVTRPELMEFISKHKNDASTRIQYIVRLCKMVQCEIALTALGAELKAYRASFGNPNKKVEGLLVVNGYFDRQHIKTILRLVRARTNLK